MRCRPRSRCSIWNLLDDKSEEQVPLMTFAEWLNFIRGRSQTDQKKMRLVMLRVLLRSRWMDRVCQVIYRGWHAALELRRGAERKLEMSARSLDAEHRGGHKDHLMLNEYQTQSWNLQTEMREDVGRLQERLADSESQAEDLTADLAAGKAVIAACRARAQQERLQSEERLAEATRKNNALRVEEVELKDTR